ncbi:uncharacterized protein J4E84_002002 [Alternaria hordeiaustralica]|uniref:uncharacterized protein n=1 Tax=Alternaria hordeiaustralica TaxID=1187925 RepID=UPI0020C2B5B7|nr:uncharacterized protein J4E84_002002 [Alternaria hordeiaustralica]KAI4695376.1 hypothetical protein J4E84_002002 [Alternaria hordeiaustralica]
MRLLRAADMTFHEFEGSSIPPYAILSHRWEGEEVTYQEMSDRATAKEKGVRSTKDQELKIRAAATKRKSGFKKIRQCCEQALEDMIEYVWVDTCCIDKSSSAELSEAINSMYTWYQHSIVCYAYLADVHTWPTYRAEDADGAWAGIIDVYEHQDGNGSGLNSRWKTGHVLAWQRLEPISHVMNSAWWTRGWTLQELIAPEEMVFYANSSSSWSKIGDKRTLLELIVKRTGIEKIELPIVHQGEDPYGLAILHCGTYNTRTGLPVVRLGPPGTNRYARDARSTGPLMTMKAEERTPTAIFMSQEPSIRVEKRRPLQVVISEDTLRLFNTVYCSAKARPSDVPSIATDQAYTFPLNCRRGAILLAGNDYTNHLLILFNIELQHVGRYTCKLVYSGDEDDEDFTIEQEKIHRLVRDMRKTDLSQEYALAREIEEEPSWSLIHGDSGPPNNRTSFADLPDDAMILAKFAPYDVLDNSDDGNLVLHVDLVDQSESPQDLYELE